MFSNIHELSEVLSTSAKKLVKIPFTTILFLVEKNKIFQVRQKKDGKIVIKIRPKIFGFLPFRTEMNIEVDPNDYVNFSEVKSAIEKFYK